MSSEMPNACVFHFCCFYAVELDESISISLDSDINSIYWWTNLVCTRCSFDVRMISSNVHGMDTITSKSVTLHAREAIAMSLSFWLRTPFVSHLCPMGINCWSWVAQRAEEKTSGENGMTKLVVLFCSRSRERNQEIIILLVTSCRLTSA